MQRGRQENGRPGGRPPEAQDAGGVSVERDAPRETESRMFRAKDAHGNALLRVYAAASMEKRTSFSFTVEVLDSAAMPPAAREDALGNVADEVTAFLRDALTAARKAGLPVREVMPE